MAAQPRAAEGWVQVRSPRETFRWTTPFFDLQFVDIKKKKKKSRSSSSNSRNQKSGDNVIVGRGGRSRSRSRDGGERNNLGSNNDPRYNLAGKMSKESSGSVPAQTGSGNTNQLPPSSTASERRMAKYKEERRRQLANQIANRLSSNQSSSSSDENDDTSSTLDKYAKYRRHHRSKPNIPQTTAPDETTTVVASAPPIVNRRRRRRSITNASPARSPSQNKHIAAASHDADGEDNADREDSPEHIYHQIGTDEVVRVSKSKPKNTNNSQSPASGGAGSKLPATASVVLDSDKIIITKNSVSRRPRTNLSQDNAVDTKKPPTPFVAINTGEKSPQSLRSRNLSSPNFQQLDLLPTATSKTANNNNSTSTTEPEKVTLDVKRKSLLNASYSSEEILLQAASSLQGLEDEFKSNYTSKTNRSQSKYPTSGTPDLERSNSTPPPAQIGAKLLSSPDMIKSVTRTLTPPVSPYHSQHQPLRFNNEATRVSPPSSTASSASASQAMPISDPMIDLHWPGRPKRNSFTGGDNLVSQDSASITALATASVTATSASSATLTSANIKRRQVSPPIKTNLPVVTSASATTPSPGTSSKPPIFPVGNSISSPPIIKPVAAVSNSDDLPPFMKEFVLRRNNNQQQTSSSKDLTPEAAKRRLNQTRPQSAFIPRSRPTASSSQSGSSAQVEQGGQVGGLPTSPRSSSSDIRRRSDFVSRYESLLNRCQAATKAVDELDLLRLQKAASANQSAGSNSQDLVPHHHDLVVVQDPAAIEDIINDEEEIADVDFDEEEVLQKCQEFQKDYQERKSQKQQPSSATTTNSSQQPTTPIPKPRQFISGRPLSEPPKPSVRTRSSSLTLHDKTNEQPVADLLDVVHHHPHHKVLDQNPVFPKPILKKSSDDISVGRPILKRKDSENSLVVPATSGSSAVTTSGGSTSTVVSSGSVTVGGSMSSDQVKSGLKSSLKRKSVTKTDDNSLPTTSKPDHVRIRSPSPDLELRPTSGILRSRNSSLGEEEFPQSILKRRNSQDDLIMDGDVSASAGTSGATSRSSPEPPPAAVVHGILKRKLSLGNSSPDQCIVAGAVSSILKKSAGASSSGQGSLEDLTSGSNPPPDGIKSILKKRHQNSTDDELEQDQELPRSILKSRRSEESLSPLSDDCVPMIPSGAGASGSMTDDNIKPGILKQRDSSRDEGYHSSKLRDKSRSPTRGACTSNSDLNEVLFSGSSGVSTPLSQGGRRSSLTFSPKRNVAEVTTSTASTAASDHESSSSSRKASFVTKTTVFLDQNTSNENFRENEFTKKNNSPVASGSYGATGGDSSVERVKFDSTSLPTSPTSEDGPASLSSSGGGGILKRKGSMGSRQPPRSQDSEAGNGSGGSGSGVTRKRSILKYDSFEVADDSPNVTGGGERDQEQLRPRRGVLKKDSSYDDTLRPILKYPLTSSEAIENFRENDFTKNNTAVPKNSSNNEEESMSSTTSSEDLENLIDQSNRGFVNVNIDPLPKSNVEDSNSEFSETETEVQIRNIPSPRKSSLHGPRLPVIPPSSVNITSDGNLACKLEALSGQAEAKLKQMAEAEAKESSISNALAAEKKVSLCRKASEDLPASEYYKIYQQSKKNSTNIIPENNVVDIVEPLEEALDMESKTEVKVQGGGIAERLAALKKNGEENWKKKVPKVVATATKSTIEESSSKKPNVVDDDDAAANISRTSKNNELLVASHHDLDNNGNNSGEIIRENTDDNRQDQNNSSTITVVENEVVQLRKKSDRPGGKVGSLQERLSQLQSAQTSWQNKVAQKDMEKYTVAGKMGTPIMSSQSKDVDRSATPSTRRTSRKESEMNAMNDEITANNSTNSNDASVENPNKENKKRKKKTPTMRRFHGSPPPASDKSYDEAAPEAMSGEVFYSEVVEVPDLDEDLDKFFTSNQNSSVVVTSSAATATTNMTMPDELSIELDDIILTEHDNSKLLNQHKRKVKPLNRNKGRPQSKNPVKALASRKDVKQSYNVAGTKVSTVMSADQTGSGNKKAEKNVHSHLSAEAKAGLAATEDFTVVQLKKDNKIVPNAEFVPYKNPGETMLLQIKGRRMCQTRLVEPQPNSVNSGDAFIALNGLEVVVWQGTYSNVIEKSKSIDLAQMIVQRKDLGCKRARRVTIVEEDKVTKANMGNKAFWKMLGCEQPQKANSAGAPEEDENYELEVNDLNQVWKVDAQTNELVPIEEYWGQPLKYDLLEHDSRVLVFDFGPELYVWNGKNAPFPTRRLGLKLAKDMIAESEARPSWTLFGRINQNMETVLFREKFLNWPDQSRLIKPTEKNSSGKKIKKENSQDQDDVKLSTDVINNFDAFEMARWPLQEPNYELEGTFLGRGRSFYDAAERRQYEIDTLSITFWHVTDKDILELPEDEYGQFYTAGTFVVRWKYKVSLTGKTLKGLPSKHVAVGRERWAYFFWQGKDSKAAEQGLSALMTVELDEEKGPQIRVEQGQEDAAFMNLWKGKMVVNKGRRGTFTSNPKPRLFFVRGECPEEACAFEVQCEFGSLRSRGAFILMDKSQKQAFVWKGQGMPEHKSAVIESLKLNWKDLAGISNISIEAEGQESSAFKSVLGSGGDRYHMNLPVPSGSIRLYHMTSVSGEFQVNEVVCPSLSETVPNVLSFNQSDIYKAEQPALFLVESGTEKLWLWQGWWPEVGHESNDTNMSTGSGMIRWHAERREAMRTIKEFQRAKFSKMSPRPSMQLVWAGHEPEEFTNLFPCWTPSDEVTILNAKFVGDSSVDRVFALLSRDNYSWDELQQRPLPDGVDPSRLEKYLNDDDFVKYLGLSREDFNAAPRWKQLEIRKEKGLF